MEIHALRIFIAAVKEGSFSRAARRLYISQPAVSAQIRNLEREYGVRLFERRGGHLRLTEAGEELNVHALRILHAVRQAEAALSNIREGVGGQIQIGACQTGLLYFLPYIVRDFRTQFPQARVALDVGHPGNLLRRLIDGHMDVCLLWEPYEEKGLIAYPAAQVPYLLVASPNHRLADEPEVSFEDLVEESFLLPLPGSSARHFMMEGLQRAGIQPRNILDIGIPEGIKQMIRADLGIGLMPEPSVESEVKAGELVALPVKDLDVRRTLGLVTRTETLQAPLVQQFIQMAREHSIFELVSV